MWYQAKANLFNKYTYNMHISRFLDFPRSKTSTPTPTKIAKKAFLSLEILINNDFMLHDDIFYIKRV